MMAMAEQEEINHLFSDSLTDEDLLRAVEQIESNQISADQAAQRSDINDAAVKSASNSKTSTGSHTQDGEFIISFEYIEKLYMLPELVSRRFHYNLLFIIYTEVSSVCIIVLLYVDRI